MDVPEPLSNIVKEWYSARNLRNAERFAGVYLGNAVIILPEGLFLHGSDAIKTHYEHIFKDDLDRSRKLRFTDRRFIVHDLIAHLVSSAETDDGEQHSFLDVLTRTSEGEFKFAFSSWTISPVKKGMDR